MPEVKFERCLTMSAYAAFLSLRRYLQSYPSSSIEAAIETLCRINSDASSLDYVGAAVLNQFISRDVELDYRLGLQAVIKEVLECGRPWWLRLVPYGREKVRSALSEDQIQCFRDAGLFDLIPDPDIVAWWDELASMVRGSADAERVVQGREAERLSFDRERKRLRELGINEDPAWVALEDNTGSKSNQESCSRNAGKQTMRSTAGWKAHGASTPD